MSGPTRPRRCKKNTKTPSASMYLGYVDDDETVEMIAQKFALLDNYYKQNKIDDKMQTQDLTEREMEEMFKITSTFTIPDIVEPEVNIDDDEYEIESEVSNDEYILSEIDFFSDASEASQSSTTSDIYDSSDDEDTQVDNIKKMKARAITEEDMELLKAYHEYYNPSFPFYYDDGDDDDSLDESYEDSDKKNKPVKRHHILNQLSKPSKSECVVVSKPYWKPKRSVNPLAPVHLKIPFQIPIPRKLARTIAPFTGYNEFPFIPEDSHYFETDIISYDLTRIGKKFVGVLIDVPWYTEQSNPENYITEKMLYNLRIDRIVDDGMVFIWTEKEFISGCVKTLSRWGFSYVENLVWVKQNIDYTVANQPYHVFNKSTVTLLMFKKGDKVNIRHQRNPDVVFDVVKRGKYLSEEKPMFVYNIIETLLPDGKIISSKSGGFLELWCKKGFRRKGWTSIAQEVPSQC